MNVYSAFWTAFRSRPLEALGALYWHITGRKVRARNRLRISLAQDQNAYDLWIRTTERNALSVEAARADIALWHNRPIFSVLVHRAADWDASAVPAIVTAMRAQIYPDWEIVIISSADASNIVVDDNLPIRVADECMTNPAEALCAGAILAKGHYLLPLPAGAELPPTALYHYAKALQVAPQARLLYGDNDWIDGQARRQNPWFKTAWNEDLALAQDYLSQAMVIAADAVRETTERGSIAAGAYEWALDVGMRYPGAVRHIPHIQSHLRETPISSDVETRVPIVQRQLDRMQTGAKASVGHHGTIRIEWPLAATLPLASIIIPTRDKVSLLRACVDSLLERTSYWPFEILIVDNGSQEPDALAYLRLIAQDARVRVLRDDRPYNFSQLNNLAAGEALGEYLCLLNNDTEIVDGGWLTEMMRQAVRPSVGAVGARLLYADGSIQHAGVVVGMGGAAGHAHRFLASVEAGYFARSHTAHQVSAVTAACLVTAKDKFLSVGGLDDESLAIAFNDVDLCLKLQAAGWRNIYTPEATLLHHESKSRGKDTSPRHIKRFRRELEVLQDRWGTEEYTDPLHHPNLNRSSETYLIKVGPTLDIARSGSLPLTSASPPANEKVEI